MQLTHHKHLLSSFPGLTYVVKAISHIDLTPCPSPWSPLTHPIVSYLIFVPSVLVSWNIYLFFQWSFCSQFYKTQITGLRKHVTFQYSRLYLPTILRSRYYDPHFMSKGLIHEMKGENLFSLWCASTVFCFHIIIVIVLWSVHPNVHRLN